MINGYAICAFVFCTLVLTGLVAGIFVRMYRNAERMTQKMLREKELKDAKDSVLWIDDLGVYSKIKKPGSIPILKYMSYLNDIFGSKYSGSIYFNNTNHYCHFKEGKCHREDGPAVVYIYLDGSISKDYYLNGEQFKNSEQWFEALNEEQKVKALFNISEWR